MVLPGKLEFESFALKGKERKDEISIGGDIAES